MLSQELLLHDENLMEHKCIDLAIEILINGVEKRICNNNGPHVVSFKSREFSYLFFFYLNHNQKLLFANFNNT